MKNGPLNGLTVEELSPHVAVPTTGRILASAGARVIKIESLAGDPFRWWGKGMNVSVEEGENPLYVMYNSDKESISIDLKKEQGKEILYQLLEQADVFLSNVRASGLKRLNLDYETLSSRYPQLIYAHFSGFGEVGPDAARPGFDLAAFWSRSGAAVDSVTVGDFPVLPSMGFGDIISGTALATGVLAAVIGRGHTGKGTFLSNSLYEAGIWCGASEVIVSQPPYEFNTVPDCTQPITPSFHYYCCKDGEWITLCASPHDLVFQRVCKVFGFDDWIDDPDYCREARVLELGRRGIITQRIGDVMKTKNRSEWEALFREADLAYECCRHYGEIYQDRQAWENQYLSRVDFHAGKDLCMPNIPFRMDAYPDENYSKIPGKVGEDTAEILRSLGWENGKIRSAAADNVVRIAQA